MTQGGRSVSIESNAGRRGLILDSVASQPIDDSFATGSTPGPGTYFCLACGSQLSLGESERLPECPGCSGSRFRRDSIFSALQEHATPTREFAAGAEAEPPRWLPDARKALPHAGNFLVRREDDGSIAVFAIERGWTRIGRSPSADLRLDDPSVSRRHALIVAEPGKDLRVLDDRSLNGVLVNGRPVDWGKLEDGDELVIGRYRLYTLRR